MISYESLLFFFDVSLLNRDNAFRWLFMKSRESSGKPFLTIYIIMIVLPRAETSDLWVASPFSTSNGRRFMFISVRLVHLKSGLQLDSKFKNLSNCNLTSDLLCYLDQKSYNHSWVRPSHFWREINCFCLWITFRQLSSGFTSCEVETYLNPKSGTFPYNQLWILSCVCYPQFLFKCCYLFGTLSSKSYQVTQSLV